MPARTKKHGDDEEEEEEEEAVTYGARPRSPRAVHDCSAAARTAPALAGRRFFAPLALADGKQLKQLDAPLPPSLAPSLLPTPPPPTPPQPPPPEASLAAALLAAVVADAAAALSDHLRASAAAKMAHPVLCRPGPSPLAARRLVASAAVAAAAARRSCPALSGRALRAFWRRGDGRRARQDKSRLDKARKRVLATVGNLHYMYNMHHAITTRPPLSLSLSLTLFFCHSFPSH